MKFRAVPKGFSTNLYFINYIYNETGLIFPPSLMGLSRVDTKWRFQFFTKYDYRFLLDVIFATIVTFFA
jgi:hypothetical protein